MNSLKGKKRSSFFTQLLPTLVLSIFLLACGGGGGGGTPDDVTPNAFSFTAQTGVELSTVVESNAVTVGSINVPVSISVTGGEYSIGSGAFTSASGQVSAGQSVRVRLTSSDSYSTETSVTLSIGGVSGTFNVTTLDDTTPDAFSFTAQTGAALSAVVESNEITVAGISVPVSISITGGEYSIEGGDYTAETGEVSLAQSVVVRLTSSDDFSTQTDATLTIGGVDGIFSVTTLDDTTPDAFAFVAQTEIEQSTQVSSNEITISGINAAAPITITGGEYSIDGGNFTSLAGTIENDQAVVVRQTSSEDVETTTEATLTIGGVEGTFTVTTEGKYTFEGFTGVALNARLQTHIVTIDDIGDSTPISIENGEYQLDRGEWTDQAGFIDNNQEVRVRANAGDDYSVTTTARLNVGESWGLFNVTTKEHGDFISVWKTDNPGASDDNQITLPLVSNGQYDFTVDWGDGSSNTITEWNQAEVTHSYAVAGEYTVIMSGTMGGLRLSPKGGADEEKIIEVRHWGALKFSSPTPRAFELAENLVFTGSDALDLSGVTELADFFGGAYNFDGYVGNWDVSSVTSLSGFLADGEEFSSGLSRWDVSQVSNFSDFLSGATNFNGDLSQWNVSNAVTMNGMLSYTGISSENYSAALNAWSNLPGIQENVDLGAVNIFYNSSAVEARNFLVDEKGWIISDEGLEQ